MDARTLEALKASIAKWERNAKAKTPAGAKIYADSCRLCKLFDEDPNCYGCPVSMRTGIGNCSHTPWVDARKAYRWWELNPERAERADTFRSAARAEVDFLKSLLPPEETA